MRLKAIAAILVGAAIAMPAFAQDKPAADEPKAEVKAKGRRHSHMDERIGSRTADQPKQKKAEPKKPLHEHQKEKN